MSSADSGSGTWSRERIEQTAHRIFDPAATEGMLEKGATAEAQEVRDLLHQARSMGGLSPAQAAVVIQVTDPALREEIKATARLLHEKAYSRRINLLAPVCPTNRCVDDCLYCPLRRANSRLKRSAHGTRDLQREVVALLDEGHKHVMLVFGNDRSGLPYVRDMVWSTYGARSGMRQIQRVDLNLDPVPGDDLRQMKDAAPLGTYHVFQETYHPASYATLHPSGPKSDYTWRLTCHDRARESGLDDVGLGVLLGAHDFSFDVVAMLQHFCHLEEAYGFGPVSVTYPRMIPTPTAPASLEPERQVSDEDFQHVVAVTRLALPYTQIALCTPATREVRLELYRLGISTVSVGSQSYPGVYTGDGEPESAGTLRVSRPRPLEELVYRMCDAGMVPSFCVACYVKRRRQSVRTEGSPVERLQERCQPNALLCLKEYLMDYASPATQTVGERVIQQELARLPEKARSMTLDLMEEAEAGLRGQTL
ncbi:[FeFe] hydrogenase H-cluster radical SAM maturase HydG [bacterium]|nr:[FeFe] hydrogenase H-cluster radical SAM maturase HydG [bacterium]